MNALPDGLELLKAEVKRIAELIACTARWVHPDTFHSLPVWYPEFARGRPSFDATWTRRLTNTKRQSGQVAEKVEPNLKARAAIQHALGLGSLPKNWTVCHVWGVDDPSFQRTNTVVADPRFYSCVANMVLLPTPLKAFTDAMPEVKAMLRVCAFHLYGWACEHPDVAAMARVVRTGPLPKHYPASWPTKSRRMLPPGTSQHTARVAAAIATRKTRLAKALDDRSLAQFPRDEVRDVLRFWKVELR
ncbi:MAG: hypothetical protein ACOZQL_27260 [Myxococcota bacterium]